MPSLALKASINYPFFGESAGPAPYTWVDPDGQDWYTRVVSSGGSITNANQAAFDTAFQSLKSTNGNDGNSLWSHVSQGYWFIGQESLTDGLMVPFYRSDVSGGAEVWGQNATNNNFTTYTKTDGLVGDGLTTGVTTTINNNNNTDWPVINGRMGYVYLSNTTLFPSKKFNPFGSSTASRAFDMQATGGQFSGIDFRICTNAGLVTNTTTSSCADGGWGIMTPYSFDAVNVICGTGKNFKLSLQNPTTTSLSNTTMKIGRTGSRYSECTIKCAILGTHWEYSDPLETNAFGLIDGIVNTLVSSLT
jgi:hypothetical protein